MMNAEKAREAWQALDSAVWRGDVVVMDGTIGGFAIRDAIAVLKSVCEMLGEPDSSPMDVERAIRTAELWGAGKMIGGDQDAVIASLLKEVKRLRDVKR